MGRPHVGRNCGVYLGAKGVDRAKDARIRAKKARDKRKNRNFQERDVVLQEFLKILKWTFCDVLKLSRSLIKEKANLIDAGADGGIGLGGNGLAIDQNMSYDSSLQIQLAMNMCGLFSSCFFLGEGWWFPRMTTLEPIYKWRMFLFCVYALEGAVNIVYPCCNMFLRNHRLPFQHIYIYYIYIN